MRALLLIAALVLVAAPASADDVKLDKAQLALVRQACERAEPACDPVALLSKLERRAVARVLADHPELVLEHAPYGKTIASVRVVNQDVFGPGDGFLRWFNIFHGTTRERVVRRELSIGPGDVWDQLRLDETARRLRDPVSTSLVAIVPLQAPEGQVELLVVTRDVWSLRANSSWEIQASKITRVQLALSENNLFGMHRLLAMSFRMDQGSYFVGPVFVDRNLAGRHTELRLRGGPLFNRNTSAWEGSESEFQLAKPLWSLDTKWGGGLLWSHHYAIDRAFVGNELKGYVCGSGTCRDANPEDDPAVVIPEVYEQRRLSLAASVVRGFGDEAWQQRLRGTYELAVQRPSLADDFPVDPIVREAFRTDVMPRSERVSAVFVGGELFEPRYRNIENVGTFELAEDTRMGLAADLKVGAALRLIGSESNFLRFTGETSCAGSLGQDGLWSVKAAGTTRVEGGHAIDTTVETTLNLVMPTILDFGRFVSQAKIAGLFRDSQNQEYKLGGDTGLRGFPINYFEGDRRTVWNTEFRTRPIPILFMRFGAVAFYDLGGTAPSYRSMKLHHDAGIGIRSLLPQLQPDVFRMDLAVALDGPLQGSLRFSAGYGQIF